MTPGERGDIPRRSERTAPSPLWIHYRCGSRVSLFEVGPELPRFSEQRHNEKSVEKKGFCVAPKSAGWAGMSEGPTRRDVMTSAATCHRGGRAHFAREGNAAQRNCRRISERNS